MPFLKGVITFALSASALRLNDDDRANVSNDEVEKASGNITIEVLSNASNAGNETAVIAEETDQNGTAYTSQYNASKWTAFFNHKKKADSTWMRDPAVELARKTILAPTQVVNIPSWTYFPPEPRLGIVTGGTPQDYENPAHKQTALMLLRYAKKKGYALYVDKNITRFSGRHPNWNKLAIMHQLMDDVPLLAWVEPDIVLTSMDFSLESLIKQTPCQGAHQSEWYGYLPKEADENTFLWLGADQHEGGQDEYKVNAAPGVIVVRGGEKAKDFLHKVWKVGETPGYFLRHRYAAHPREGQAGEWPYEIGAFWDVLAAMPDTFMRNACIGPVGHLHSLNNAHYRLNMKLRRVSDLNSQKKLQVSSGYLKEFGLSEWAHF